MHSLRHILRRALRSLWENLYLNLMASLVIAASLLLIGVYLTVQYNLNAIVDSWDRDVHISAYFRPEVSVERRLALREELQSRREVSRVQYISEAEAQAWLKERVPDIGPVLQELGETALPASLELTLVGAEANPESIRRFAEELPSTDFEAIDHGQEWVERFNAFLSLLKLLGAVLGALIGVAALFLVANTVHLIVYNRRLELEVQKLVGATNGFIMAPFLIEGLCHGLLGGLVATLGLFGVHRGLVVRLQEALQLGLAGELAFLPTSWVLGLVLLGLCLGVLASAMSVQRFLQAAR